MPKIAQIYNVYSEGYRIKADDGSIKMIGLGIPPSYGDDLANYQILTTYTPPTTLSEEAAAAAEQANPKPSEPEDPPTPFDDPPPDEEPQKKNNYGS